METIVNKIVPHDMEMEVHVSFRDEAHRPHSSADVIVFIERRDHPLSEVKSLAIQQALNFLSQILSSAAKARDV